MTHEDNPKSNPPRGGGATETAEKTTVFSRDGEHVDPQEYAALLDLYDNSFRNIAEGEVVKGAVLKATPSEGIVDVCSKPEGLISLEQLLNQTPPTTSPPSTICAVPLHP